jgi:hypothetical protein
VETTNVVDLGVLNELPDLRLLQVVKVVVVGSTEISAQASVVTSDDGTAAASLLLRVDSVLNTETSSLDSIVEDGRVLVVAGTTNIDNTVGREDVLGTSGAVLGSTASNELGIVVVEEIFVKRDVLFLSKNSVIGLQAILVKKSLVTLSLDVFLRQRDNLSAGGRGREVGVSG